MPCGLRFLTGLAALSLLAMGCTSPPQTDRAIVRGKVSYQGKNLQKGVITFIAVDDAMRRDAGLIRPDGTYTLTNAPKGACKITIDANKIQDLMAYEKQNIALPSDVVPKEVNRMYCSVERTTLTYEVKPGDQKDVNFELQPQTEDKAKEKEAKKN